MTRLWQYTKQAGGVMQSHPRLIALVVWILTILLHPAGLYTSPLIIGAILLDDVNTITTKDIMPGVADWLNESA